MEAFNTLSSTVQELDTDQLAASLRTIAETFRETPEEVRASLDGLSRLSTTISSRDDQLATLLANTNKVTGLLAARNQEVELILRDGSTLLAELNARQEAISRLLEGTRRLSIKLRGLIDDNEERIGDTLEQLEWLVDILQRNQDALVDGLRRLGPFTTLFTNLVGTGRWFDNFLDATSVATLLPPGFEGPPGPGPGRGWRPMTPRTLGARAWFSAVAFLSVVALVVAGLVFVVEGGVGLRASAPVPDRDRHLPPLRGAGARGGRRRGRRPAAEGPDVLVTFTVRPGVPIPADALALVVAPTVVADRAIQLAPAYTGGPELADGALIPLERTAVPPEFDDLLIAVQKLSTSLGPQGLNRTGALSEALSVTADNLAGNGQRLNSALDNAARAINTLSSSRQDLPPGSPGSLPLPGLGGGS